MESSESCDLNGQYGRLFDETSAEVLVAGAPTEVPVVPSVPGEGSVPVVPCVPEQEKPGNIGYQAHPRMQR